MHTPALTLAADDDRARPRPVTLVVYAPFAADPVLSNYPDGSTDDLAEHPLTAALQAVAGHGVQVCALIDRAGDNTGLICAAPGGALEIDRRWKHDMNAPRTLANLLRHADQLFPGSEIVLSLEGHGAGFLPEIDPARIAPGASSRTTSLQDPARQRRYSWRIDDEAGQHPEPEDGQPYLPMTESTLTGHLLPTGHSPMSTWGLGWALGEGLAARPEGDRRLAVLHFNNCFNFCAEVLHTVARHARHAVGYVNYNFFTAGRSYPGVFGSAVQGSLGTARALARRLAQANANELALLPLPHPTLGGAIDLSRMGAVADALDRLSLALIADLPARQAQITAAVVAAQKYDTQRPFKLADPDSLTDLRSLAACLEAGGVSDAVKAAAGVLRAALSQIKVYGASGAPYMAPHIHWDFGSEDLAMGIFLPDPGRQGAFDWRTPYYLSKTDGEPAAQPHVIALLRDTHWVDFLRKYHQRTAMQVLLAPRIPPLPVVLRCAPRSAA